MDSFYSLLYVKTNNLTDEHFTVALLTAGSEGPRLHISEKRLRLLKEVLHRNTFLSIRRHIKALKLQIDKYRTANRDLLLFDPTYSIQQLNRLHKLSKKAIRYSEPVSVNAWMDEDCHQQLMVQLMGEKTAQTKTIKKSFYHRWKAHCNGNRYLDFRRNILSNKIKRKIESSIRLDLYSKDKSLIVKGVDFETSSKNVKERVRDLLILSDEFSGFHIYCVHPTPRKKIGKELLIQAKEKLSLKIEFVDYNTFDAMDI